MPIDWDSQPLGEISDAEIARRLGVSQPSVYEQRTKRGIPPAVPQGSVSNIDWSSVALGERTDAEIAAEVGVTRQAVAYQRRKRGIAPRGRLTAADGA